MSPLVEAHDPPAKARCPSKEHQAAVSAMIHGSTQKQDLNVAGDSPLTPDFLQGAET